MSIPDGYRILEPHETVKSGDKYDSVDGKRWMNCNSTIGKEVNKLEFEKPFRIIRKINAANLPPGYRILDNEETILKTDTYWYGMHSKISEYLLAKRSIDIVCSWHVNKQPKDYPGVTFVRKLETQQTNMSTENKDILTVSKQNVLNAASKCSDAKRILQEIFPDAFKKELLNISKGTRVRSKHGFTYTIVDVSCLVDKLNKYNGNNAWSIISDNYALYNIKPMSLPSLAKWLMDNDYTLIQQSTYYLNLEKMCGI